MYHPKMANEAYCEVYFRDSRPPHEIQFQLESTLMTLFQPYRDGSKLILVGAVRMAGCPYSFQLRFDAALLTTNAYTIRISTSWEALPAEHHDYFRRTSESWFKYWTQPFKSAPPPAPGEGSEQRYRAIEEQSLNAESHLTDAASVQREILAEMHKGKYFSTAHKEGGTNIRWRAGRYTRADYGESEETETFSDEASFLAFLRKFYDWETSSHVYPNKVSDFDAWKLILRKLRQ